MRSPFIALVLLTIFVLSSCITKDEIDNLRIQKVRWEPTVAVPLLKTKITLRDLLEQTSTGYIEVDQDNLIHLIYQDEFESQRAKEIVSIANQQYNGAFNLTPIHIASFNSTGSVDVNYTSIFNFGPEDVEIDSILMGSCGFESSLSSTFRHNVEVQITLQDVQLDQNPLVLNYVLNDDGSGMVQSSQNRDLTGAWFDLTKSGDKAFSQLKADFNVKITQVGSNSISTTDELTFDTRFLYNEYNVLYGYIDPSDISSQGDSITFDVFESVDSNLQNLKYRIADPSIKFKIGNSFGIPVRASINEISTLSRTGGKITATGIPSPLPIPRPTSSQVGEHLYDSFELNTTNSNIDDLLSNVPHTFIYDVEAQANPASASERNFMTYNSHMSFGVDIDIPMHFSAEEFVLQKDIDADSIWTSDPDNPEEVELKEVTARLFLKNDFPLDLLVQAYFLDDQGGLIDSLITSNPYLLKSAAVDQNGRSITPTEYTFDVSISEEKYNRIQESHTVRFKAALNTYKDGSTYPDVKIYDDYALEVKLGIQASALINLELE